MEELVCHNTTMQPSVSNPPHLWGSEAFISCGIPVTSFSSSVLSVHDLAFTNAFNNFVGFQQQFQFMSSSPVECNSSDDNAEHHRNHLIPSDNLDNGLRFLDKYSSYSSPTRPGCGSVWGHALSTEILATSMFIPKPEINQFDNHIITSCLQAPPSSNDLLLCHSFEAQESPGMPDLHLPTLQTESIESMESHDEVSPTATEHEANGAIKPMVLSASLLSEKQTNSKKNKRNYISEAQSVSQGSSHLITQPKASTQSKTKVKSKSKRRSTHEDNQYRMQYSSSSSASTCCLVFGRTDEAATEPDAEAIASMREMIYRAAAFRPVNLGAEVLEKPKRKNVRISSDPQTVAARQRREKISDRIRILQRLVPGGSKMDTASMLDEAVNYLKFLKTQVKALQSMGNNKKSFNIENSIMDLSSTSNPLNSFSLSCLDYQVYQNRL